MTGGSVLRLSALVALLALGACQSAPPAPRPDFLGRVQRDCEAGSQDACSLLQGLLAIQADPTPPPRRRVQRSQAERNADALMQGVARARATSRAAPAAVPDTPGDGEI